MRSTRDVIDDHLKRFAERDLDGILADYAPDAVLFTPAGPFKGAAIRALLDALIREFAKPGATFDLRHMAAEGDVGYILWTAETADNRYDLATDTFVVRDGRIEAQSFAGTIVAKRARPVDAAPAPAPSDVAVPSGAA